MAANTKALEIMSEIEGALSGGRPFGMSVVRASCTSVAVTVHRIIASLHELAPGRYRALDARFRLIQECIAGVLQAAPPPADGELVLPLEAVDGRSADQVGGKMAALGEVSSRLGLEVPAGFVVTAAGFRRLLAHGELQAEVDRRVQAASADDPAGLFQLSSNLQQLLATAPLPPELEDAIRAAYAGLERRLGAGVRVSLRSSALGEDSAEASFAGQYRSELNVGADHLLEAYREVVASKYSVPAMTYRLNRGLRDEDVAMGVGCMAMIPAAAGGVAYSSSPVGDGDPAVVVTAAFGPAQGGGRRYRGLRHLPGQSGSTPRGGGAAGAGEGLPPGERPRGGADPGRGGARGTQPPRHHRRRGGRPGGDPAALEGHYGRAVDVEWALTPERRVVVLQCRPLLRVEAGVSGVGREPSTWEWLRWSPAASPRARVWAAAQ